MYHIRCDTITGMDWGHLSRAARALATELLDAILPPHARTARTKGRTPSDIPLLVTSHALLGARITTLMDYRAPAVQDLIRSLKFDGNEHAARLAAAVLADYLREEIAAMRAFSRRPIYLIPLPLHPKRERERGFNQIALVLDRLPLHLRNGTHAAVDTTAFVRSRDTPHQTTLHRGMRLRNMRDAFTVADPLLLRHAQVILIDDVTTTGATLASAGKALHKAKADVTLIALARA